MTDLKNRIKQVALGVDTAIDWLLSAMIAATVVVMLVSILFRYVLNHSLSWSDEFVRYLFVWLTLLGSAVVFRDREHIRIDYFIDLFPPALRRAVDILVLCAVSLFFLATLVLGAMWVHETRGTWTSALGWPLNWFFYAALPASSLLGVYYAVRRFVSRRIGEGHDSHIEDAVQSRGSAL